MSTIAFVNGKGGSGKTTLALSFILALAESGHFVSFNDADAQRTLTAALDMIRAQTGANGGAEAFDRITPIEARASVHHTVIDSPPRLGSHERALHHALPSADVVILPCTPSFPDIWSTIDSLKELRTLYPKPKYAIALTRVDARTAFAHAIRDNLAAENLGVPILKAEIPQLACFGVLPMFGWKRLTQPAQKAVTDLALEILALAEPKN